MILVYAAEQLIVAGAAEQLIFAGIAKENIIAGAAEELKSFPAMPNTLSSPELFEDDIRLVSAYQGVVKGTAF